MKTLKIDFYGSEDAISVFKSFLENNQMSLENENAEDLSDIDSDDWLKKIKFKEKKATIKTSSFEYNQIENISEFLSGLAEENPDIGFEGEIEIEPNKKEKYEVLIRFSSDVGLQDLLWNEIKNEEYEEDYFSYDIDDDYGYNDDQY